MNDPQLSCALHSSFHTYHSSFNLNTYLLAKAASKPCPYASDLLLEIAALRQKIQLQRVETTKRGKGNGRNSQIRLQAIMLLFSNISRFLNQSGFVTFELTCKDTLACVHDARDSVWCALACQRFPQLAKVYTILCADQASGIPRPPSREVYKCALARYHKAHYPQLQKIPTEPEMSDFLFTVELSKSGETIWYWCGEGTWLNHPLSPEEIQKRIDYASSRLNPMRAIDLKHLLSPTEPAPVRLSPRILSDADRAACAQPRDDDKGFCLLALDQVSVEQLRVVLGDRDLSEFCQT
jgi:hypothetical protein